MFPAAPRTCRGLARAAACTALWFALPAAPSLAAGAHDSNLLIYSTEGNRLRRYDFDTVGGTLVEDVLVYAAGDELQATDRAVWMGEAEEYRRLLGARPLARTESAATEEDETLGNALDALGYGGADQE